MKNTFILTLLITIFTSNSTVSAQQYSVDNTIYGTNAGSDFRGSNSGAVGDDDMRYSSLFGFGAARSAFNMYGSQVLGHAAGMGSSMYLSTAIGMYSLYNAINVKNTVAIGYGAGYDAIGKGINGMRSVLIGTYAGYETIGENNVLIGLQAGPSRSLSNSIAIGHNSLHTLNVEDEFENEISGNFDVNNKNISYPGLSALLGVDSSNPYANVRLSSSETYRNQQNGVLYIRDSNISQNYISQVKYLDNNTVTISKEIVTFNGSFQIPLSVRKRISLNNVIVIGEGTTVKENNVVKIGNESIQKNIFHGNICIEDVCISKSKLMEVISN